MASDENDPATIQTPLLLSNMIESLRNLRSNAVLAASRLNRLQEPSHPPDTRRNLLPPWYTGRLMPLEK